MPTETTPVIRFDAVEKSFGKQKVLRGLSFDVPRGKTLAIMGGSGSGKSVTLRHIIGLIRADAGHVLVEGQDIAELRGHDLAALRRRMGYVFQEGALINWLTVEDNVALPLRENTDLPDSEILDRVHAKLELVQVPDAGQKMPSNLSGGMKKRVGLARALVTDPEIILYDEPNAGLDPEIARSINNTMRELSENLGSTAVVVEHRIPCVKTVSDEVIFLQEGQALVQMTTQEFFTSDHPRLVQFLGDQSD